MAKVEWRIANAEGQSLFSERFPTKEAAQGRIDEYEARGWNGHKNLVILMASDTPEPYRGPVGFPEEEVNGL